MPIAVAQIRALATFFPQPKRLRKVMGSGESFFPVNR